MLLRGGGLLGLTLVLTLNLFSLNFTSPTLATTQSSSSDIALSIAEVLALSVANCNTTSDPDSSKLNIRISPTAGSDSYGANCQNLNIATNTPGYSLTVSALSNDNTNSLTYQNPTTISPLPKIPSIASSATPTSPAFLLTNNWGFAVANKLGFDTSYSTNPTNIPTNKFANLPTTGATIANTTTMPTSSDNYTFYYATRIPSTNPAGTYSTTITYTAIGKPIPPIVYPEAIIVPNIASTIAPSGNGTGTNGPQFSIYVPPATITTTGIPTTITIGNQPCTDPTINTAGTSITCTGPINLSPGSHTVKINNKTTTAIVTYSDTVYPTLQGLTSTACNALPLETPTIHRDTRDSQLYYVSKLKKDLSGTTFWCWMTDNLRYKPNGDTSGTVTPGFSATQVANTGQYLTVDGTSAGASSPPITSNLDVGKYVDPIIVTGGSNLCRSSNTNPLMPTSNISKCGLLYNSYTAYAGTVLYTQALGIAAGSICPANWRLPTGSIAGSLGDFSNLDIAYGGNGNNRSGLTDQSIDPLNSLWRETGVWRGLFSGDYDSTFALQGTHGFYMSSMVSGSSGAYPLIFQSTYINSGWVQPSSRPYGTAVRCVIN